MKVNLKYSIFSFTILVIVCISACIKVNVLEPDEVLLKPIENLTEQELELYHLGNEVFNRSFGKEDGLGPVFIASTCRTCHFNGGKGHPFNEIIRFGKWEENGAFDAMHEQSGPQLQYRSLDGYPKEEIPADADGIVHLNPPSIAGLGLLEAVADQSILSWADPNDADNDGISGRPAFVDEPLYVQTNYIIKNQAIDAAGRKLGRFGKKAFTINLYQQTVRALLEDIGITSEAEIEDPENWLAEADLLHSGDGIADPEIAEFDVNNLVYFLRATAAPPRRNETAAEVINGEIVFNAIGCNKCHRPNFTTAESSLPFLSNKEIFPYSDLLLHDMGPGLDDGYTEGAAETNEWRTPPLWGIGLAESSQGENAYYLHDGRATNLHDAIVAHGGEASSIVENYNAISANEKDDLLAFLRSL